MLLGFLNDEVFFIVEHLKRQAIFKIFFYFILKSFACLFKNINICRMAISDEKPSVVGFQATPQLKTALRKFGGEASSINKVARDIIVSFLVANGFLADSKEAAVHPGMPQAYFLGTEEEKAEILRKKQAQAAHMRKKVEESGIAIRPRGKARPKPEPVIITSAQMDETNRTFTREQLREIIAEQVSIALKKREKQF